MTDLIKVMTVQLPKKEGFQVMIRSGREVSIMTHVLKSTAGITLAHSDGAATTVSLIPVEGEVVAKRFEGITGNVQLHDSCGKVILTAIGAAGLQYARVTVEGIGELNPLEASFAGDTTEHALGFGPGGLAVLAARHGDKLSAAVDMPNGSTQERVLSTNLTDSGLPSLVQVATTPAGCGRRAVLWVESDGRVKAHDLTDLAAASESVDLLRSIPLGVSPGHPAALTLAYDVQGRAVAYAAFTKAVDPAATGAATAGSGVDYAIYRWDDLFGPKFKTYPACTITNAAPGSLQGMSDNQANVRWVWVGQEKRDVMTALSAPCGGMTASQIAVPGPVRIANLVVNGTGDALITYWDGQFLPGVATCSTKSEDWTVQSPLDAKPALEIGVHVDAYGVPTVALHQGKQIALFTQPTDKDNIKKN